ncbi:MAG: DUF1223 domain-containing protein [Hyphomicrobiaceae bacterium]|nr:DUF1223 domain-containing protein [Hyphomicrobiaceae bacterium]
MLRLLNPRKSYRHAAPGGRSSSGWFGSMPLRRAVVGFAAAFATAVSPSTGFATGAAAGDTGKSPPTVSAVVELFTSQGCSSCPPADKLFEMYVNRPDIVALSLPVDYWDYLGWKDTLASARNTERQRAYAKARGDGAVYTPQVVVNGMAHAVGSDASQIERQIAKTSMEFARRQVPMRFTRLSSVIVVEAGRAPPDVKIANATIWLAAVQAVAEIEIARGENHGRTIRYFNVVHELSPVGTWNGEPLTIRLAAQSVMMPGKTRYAVLMQEGAAGPIVGAAWLGY